MPSSAPRTSIALFTRDLRVRDNPTLAAAVRESDVLVPLFVFDAAILRSSFHRPNRARFLLESLHDLDRSLRSRGAALVVRRGDWANEVATVVTETGAVTVHVSRDASGFARTRLERLRRTLGDRVRIVEHDETLFVVAPGAVRPAERDHMAVFTPYFRQWQRVPLRDVVGTPRSLRLPSRLARGRLPTGGQLVHGSTSPDLPAGGESAGRTRMTSWFRTALSSYDDDHDALGRDNTSRLSPYLHLGCLSPVELVRRARAHDGAGSQAFVRQVAWRDFYAQILAARPEVTQTDYRSRADRWHSDDEELAAWQEGRTGYPIVDAGMRQLAREGWMHNRARLVVAHFLCKTLYIDWREGAGHFTDLLVDADVASNTMNWQWVAGTGTDARFNRTYNVVAQAERHDPDGRYVRRYVEELAGFDGASVHEPWRLTERQRGSYPLPIVDQREARDRLRRGRS